MTKLIRRQALGPDLAVELHPLMRRIYRQRGVAGADELELGLAGLEPPDSLLGMDAALELLLTALREQWKILIVADYDADGATSCALAIECLHAFGFDRVNYIIPDRARHGYGLSPDIVELAACRDPDMLITVDNGVSSVSGVAAAQATGMRVLITDHHLPGESLPEADAIINPNQPGCGFPWKNTAGVGVIFYVMAALRARLRENGWFGNPGPPEPDLRECLDLVALGTVADVASLDHNNRILVNEGLRRIRAGRTRPGISALFAVADSNINPNRRSGHVAQRSRGNTATTQIGYRNKNGQVVKEQTNAQGTDHNQFVYVLVCSECKHHYGSNGSDNWQRKCPKCQGGAPGLPFEANSRAANNQQLEKKKFGTESRQQIENMLNKAGLNATAADLAFRVAPRLNAAGRLEDMSEGIECLLAETPKTAWSLALKLDEINTRRKVIQAKMDTHATELLAQAESIAAAPGKNLPTGLCLYDPAWHQGVVGILASRIKDRFHRPVIAFAADPENPEADLKGSARSIAGFHIRDALDAIASRNPGLISRFGGHAMAAGLSLPPDSLETFRAAFADEASRQIKPEQLEAVLLSDGPVESEWFTLEVAQMLRNAGPWGKDFPEPVFDGRFHLRRQQPLKEKHLRMTLSPLEDPNLQIEAIAFNVEHWPDPEAPEISLAYRLEINEFRGERNLQLVVERILPATLPD